MLPGERPCRGHAPDLGDDRPALVVGGLGDGELLAEVRLVLHGQVPALVRRRAPDHRHVHARRPVEEELLAVEVHHLDEILGRPRALLPPGLAGIDEGVEPGAREEPRPPGRHVATELGEDPLGERVGLDQILAGERPELGAVVQPGADDPLDEAGSGEPAESRRIPVPEGHHAHERQVPRRAGVREALGEGDEDRLGHRVAAPRAPDEDAVPVPDEPGRGLEVDERRHPATP